MSVTKTWKVQFMYKNDLGAVDKLLSSRLAAFSLFMGGDQSLLMDKITKQGAWN